MGDREMLELAAKAARMRVRFEPAHDAFWLLSDDGLESEIWDPLNDDGDALRLAVKLEILVLTARGFAVANHDGFAPLGGAIRIDIGDDALAAARLAITRAAAQIGRAMP